MCAWEARPASLPLAKVSAPEPAFIRGALGSVREAGLEGAVSALGANGGSRPPNWRGGSLDGQRGNRWLQAIADLPECDAERFDVFICEQIEDATTDVAKLSRVRRLQCL